MEDIGKRKGKVNWGKSAGAMNHERLSTLKNNLRVLEGRGEGCWMSLVVGIKEGMYCMAPWVWCINNKSWNTASKTNDVFYGD